MQEFRTSGRHHATRHGFTLIEILIVLAIIGILAAILFPVFGRVRENGRATVCSSNLRQLGLAFQQYTQDTGGRFPGAGNYQKWDLGGHWVSGTGGAPVDNPANSANVEKGALYPYIRNSAVFMCPSNENAKQKRLTYSMNCAMSGISSVRVKAPSDMILLVDELNANDGYFYAVDKTVSTDALTKIHNGGGNMLFADNHSKFFPFNKFPLDSANTAAKGAGMKSATVPPSGTPRFHDPAFGPNGSAYPTPFTYDDITKDSCAETVQ